RSVWGHVEISYEPSRRGVCTLRLLQACHEPALSVAVVEMDQDAGRVLSQVAQASFHQRARLVLSGPGGALRFLVDHPFHRFHDTSSGVLERAGNDALLADGKLQTHCRFIVCRLSI